MANLKDYLDWRGDLDFEERGFNELDNLVFCQLSYTDMRQAFEQGNAHSLSEIITSLDQTDGLSILLADGVEKHDEYAAFARAAAQTRRFGNLLLYDYEDIYDKDEQIQFCAVTFRIDDHTDYIAFRGTDDSIVGWKEDFMISFEKIPAQDAAADYVTKHLRLHPDHQYYIGGHSKGANLALYAAARLPSQMQAQVLHLYVNDGPGLCSDVLDTGIIQSIDHKTTKIVPEYDVIGKIFEMPITDNRIVRSSETGIMQHGILTWQLKDGKLDIVSQNAPGSQWIGRVLDEWIGGVAPSDRKTFIDDLFDSMAAGGTDTFYELQHLGPEGFEKVLSKAAGVNRISLSVGAALPLTAAVGPEQAKRTQDRFTRFTDLLKNSFLARSLILIAGGLFCMLIPDSALPLTVALVMTAASASVVAYTAHELWKSHWNLSAVQTQIYISIASVVVYSMVMVKEGALMLISNLAFGILFLFLSYHIIQRAHSQKRWSAHWWGSVTEAAILIIMALFILTAPSGTIRTFTFACGCVFLTDGIAHLISGFRQRHRQGDGPFVS